MVAGTVPVWSICHAKTTPRRFHAQESLAQARVLLPGQFPEPTDGKMALKNDAELARTLAITPAVVSRIRNKKAPVSASVLLMIHEATEIAIPELRKMMGDSRRLFS